MGIFIGILILIVLFGIMYFVRYGIPEGWEDDAGFHYGRKE